MSFNLKVVLNNVSQLRYSQLTKHSHALLHTKHMQLSGIL